MFLRGDGEFVDASEATRRAERARLDARVRDLEARVAAWSRDPSTEASALATQRARLEAMRAQRAALASATTPTRGRWFDARAVEVSPDVPRLATIEQQIARYFREVNEHNRVELADRRAPAPAPGAASYSGTESCRECHEDAYQVWTHTRHSHAYRTLEVVSKNFNLSCVGCHVTGYRASRVGARSCRTGASATCSASRATGRAACTSRPAGGRRARRRSGAPSTGSSARRSATRPSTPTASTTTGTLPFILGPGHGRPEGSPIPDPDASAAHLGEVDAAAD
ncbi:MAG: multiheme c-type cytochrome [Polyangiales bacterium]